MRHRSISFAVLTLLIALSHVACAHEPIVVASGGGSQAPKQPQMAMGTDEDVHIVFGVGDGVRYARSSNSGETFGKPMQTFRVSNLSLGMRRGPRIATTKDAIVVTAIGGRIGKGRDGDVLSWRSTDDGMTWQEPVRVNDAADSAREGLHAMGAGENGSVWCVWLDLRDKKTEIYAARSMDSGASWEPNIRVYHSPDGNVCECCHPSVIVANNGLHVMFRNSLAGNRDMYVTSSVDEGKSFTPAKKLGHGTWHLDACPMDGGMLAVNGSGQINTVWRREGNIYTAMNTNSPEVLLGRGRQPWIASAKDGTCIVWSDDKDNILMFQGPGSHSAKKLAAGGRDPVIVTSADGRGCIIACWESRKGSETDIVVQRLDEIN